MKPSSPARAILETVAGSDLADPIDRAAAQLALLLGDYPASMTLEDIIAGSWSPPTSPPIDLPAVVRAMADANRSSASPP